MKIICSDNMPFAREAFGTLGDVTVAAARALTAADVRDTDLLAIRSTTRVNRELLDGSRVRFVGTATIGTDHMDTGYLDRAGIAWCAAPGCNANSVSEYVAAALLRLARRHGFRLHGMTLGVVGVGNVGSRVAAKAAALGMRVLRNDPPLKETTRRPEFVELDDVLREADAVTLHVPLTRGGPHPTFHLAGDRFFASVRPGSVFLNSARGGAMESAALARALAARRVRHAVLDTWEDEPCMDPELLRAVDIGTPHIAGYSFDGKVEGTMMVYRAACRFLGVQPSWTPDALLPPPRTPDIGADAAGRDDEDVLDEVVRRVYDIEADDRAMRERAVADPAARAKGFDALRKHYPERREFRFTTVMLANGGPALAAKLRGLGFTVAGV